VKALIYRKFGDPEVLEWVDNWPDPVVRPDSVVIRCIAGSVNPKDVLLRKGKFRKTLARDPLPRISGLDIAGEVVEIGDGIASLAAGDIIFGMTNRFCGGVHSELTLLKADEVAPAPVDITVEEAASIPLAAQTALQALRDRCGLKAGQKVLINGASGGVGHFAVQIAKALGAEVHAVCGPNHLNFVASLGADIVHDYTAGPAPTIAVSFDCVFDVFGRYSWKDFTGQLGSRGIFVSTVPKPATMWGEVLAKIGLNKRRRLVLVKSNTKDLNQIQTWVATGRLKPHVEKVFEATNARKAHRHIEGRHTTGKIVLSFG
jgi:NADPH:quinone reductase-like Zn-dependent oxidoreductase